MEKDKKKRNEYPKLCGDDQRWKQQDEFDSAGAQRELEDKEKNASIESAKDLKAQDSETNKKDNSDKSQQNASRDRDQP